MIKSRPSSIPTHSIIAAGALLCLYKPATADMHVRFVESAPKDWFSLVNNSECLVETLGMEVDLEATRGKLIFDTTSAGQGVEVFQPFEKREGEIQLASTANVLDGDNKLAILVKNLAPGASISFTIDVDDTLTDSELGNIRVSGSEIEGGVVTLSFGSSPPVSGIFDSDARITLLSPACETAPSSE